MQFLLHVQLHNSAGPFIQNFFFSQGRRWCRSDKTVVPSKQVRKEAFKYKMLFKMLSAARLNAQALIPNISAQTCKAYKGLSEQSTEYSNWPKVCGHLAIRPICGSSANCCHKVGVTQVYQTSLYVVAS